MIAAIAAAALLMGAAPTPDPAGCALPKATQDIFFSGTKYPHIRSHMRRAIRHGEPRVLVLKRAGAGDRRDRLLESWPTKRGYDRDEYPPAVGRIGWRADVEYVVSGENRSHGAVMGLKLRRFCSETRWRYAWY
jgi:hypothetical protein